MVVFGFFFLRKKGNLDRASREREGGKKNGEKIKRKKKLVLTKSALFPTRSLLTLSEA